MPQHKLEEKPEDPPAINIHIKETPLRMAAQSTLLSKNKGFTTGFKDKSITKKKKVDRHLLARQQTESWKESLANFKKVKNNVTLD